jgi:quercetin dioxygenase-like cupin family protein
MITRRTLLESTTAGLLLPFALPISSALAQGAPPKSKRVFENDLPDIDMKNWAVTVIEVSYGPGDLSRAHRHPGITLAYVLEGEIRCKVGDGPEKTYAAGEMFMERPNEVHATSANASTSKPAKLLAVLLAEKGKPLTTPVDM